LFITWPENNYSPNSTYGGATTTFALKKVINEKLHLKQVRGYLNP